jgi:hypothetical protein
MTLVKICMHNVESHNFFELKSDLNISVFIHRVCSVRAYLKVVQSMNLAHA